MNETNDTSQSNDIGEHSTGLSHPDIFTRIAGSHLSRRDMMKASVVAGGLVWSAPLLLSGTAGAAAIDCCSAGMAVTVAIAAGAEVATCETLTCLPTANQFTCDSTLIANCGDIIFNQIQRSPGNIDVKVDAPVRVIAVGAVVGGTCFTIECSDPTVGLPHKSGPFTVTENPSQTVIHIEDTTVGQVELSLCIPANFTALC